MKEERTTIPASANSLATSDILRMFSSRSSGLNPRFLLSPGGREKEGGRREGGGERGGGGRGREERGGGGRGEGGERGRWWGGGTESNVE